MEKDTFDKTNEAELWRSIYQKIIYHKESDFKNWFISLYSALNQWPQVHVDDTVITAQELKHSALSYYNQWSESVLPPHILHHALWQKVLEHHLLDILDFEQFSFGPAVKQSELWRTEETALWAGRMMFNWAD